MITDQQANAFAEQWIKAWNNHDLDAILEHYHDEVVFYSPLVAALRFNPSGELSGKADLKAYFSRGLDTYPDLQFRLQQIFSGIHSIVLYYTSVNGKLAAEVFEFDDKGKAVRVLCNYVNK